MRDSESGNLIAVAVLAVSLGVVFGPRQVRSAAVSWSRPGTTCSRKRFTVAL